jgi:hypothetical protein
MQIIDLKQMHQYYWTWVTLREAAQGKDNEREGNQKLECGLMCLLYRNKYRNLLLARATMGRGLGKNKEDWKR